MLDLHPAILARWGFADGKAGLPPAYLEQAYRIAYTAGKRMATSATQRQEERRP